MSASATPTAVEKGLGVFSSLNVMTRGLLVEGKSEWDISKYPLEVQKLRAPSCWCNEGFGWNRLFRSATFSAERDSDDLKSIAILIYYNGDVRLCVSTRTKQGSEKLLVWLKEDNKIDVSGIEQQPTGRDTYYFHTKTHLQTVKVFSCLNAALELIKSQRDPEIPASTQGEPCRDTV